MGLISASPLLERPRRRHLISKIMPQMGNSPHLRLGTLVLLEVGNTLASQLLTVPLSSNGNFPMPRGADGPDADHQIHQ